MNRNLALENKRLKAILMSWSPPQLIDCLRGEIERLKKENQSALAKEISEMRHQFLKEATEIISEMARLRKTMATEKFKKTGIVARAKKTYRKMGHYVSAFLAERGA